MPKKMRALIVIDNMDTGGIASSLYNFLSFNSEELDCDLLVFNKDSIDRNKIPGNVNVLNTPKLLKVLGMSQSEIRRESLLLAAIRALLVAITRIINGEAARKLLMPFLNKMQGYDLAISYAHDNGWKSLSKGCNDFVAKKVTARAKIAYIHCDYANYGGYDKRQAQLFERFDYIAFVSHSCEKNFRMMFPRLKTKTIVLENFTNTDQIWKLADLGSINYDQSIKNFVSVCRLSSVKGLDRVIHAFHDLEEEGLKNYKWVIVGDGPEYPNLVSAVKAYGLDNRIVFVGNKSNPYPYLKNAYALLVPSLHEAAPMVYSESAALGVPIITTETCSAIELVHDRKIGIVVKNDEDSIKDVLKELLCGRMELIKITMPEGSINENAKKQLAMLLMQIKNSR